MLALHLDCSTAEHLPLLRRFYQSEMSRCLTSVTVLELLCPPWHQPLTRHCTLYSILSSILRLRGIQVQPNYGLLIGNSVQFKMQYVEYEPFSEASFFFLFASNPGTTDQQSLTENIINFPRYSVFVNRNRSWRRKSVTLRSRKRTRIRESAYKRTNA